VDLEGEVVEEAANLATAHSNISALATFANCAEIIFYTYQV